MPVESPFAVFTFIVAPAVLTNASSVLALGTSNRFARNVERARLLIKSMEGKSRATDADFELRMRQIARTERRAILLIRALSSFYFSLASFAAGSLTALLAAVTGTDPARPASRWLLLAATVIGILGLCGLIAGGALLIAETRLALRSLREDAAYFRSQHDAVEAVGGAKA